jgi:hypothetical protein
MAWTISSPLKAVTALLLLCTRAAADLLQKSVAARSVRIRRDQATAAAAAFVNSISCARHAMTKEKWIWSDRSIATAIVSGPRRRARSGQRKPLFFLAVRASSLCRRSWKKKKRPPRGPPRREPLPLTLYRQYASPAPSRYRENRHDDDDL